MAGCFAFLTFRVNPIISSWVFISHATDRIKELWNNTTEARHVSGVSLNGGLVEGPLSESAQLKPGLPWKTQDVRDARVMGYLPRTAANEE